MPKAKKIETTTEASEVVSIGTGINSEETVFILKAIRPMTKEEHEQLSEKIRFENQKSGVKIILMPNSCEFGGVTDATGES